MGYVIPIILLTFVLIIGGSIGISFLIYQIVKKQQINKVFRLFAFVPQLILFYFIYDAIYPPDEFYKEDFTEVTNQPFPHSGKIIAKSASYPDQFGDYASCALIELDEKEFQQLIIKLSNEGFTDSEEVWGSDELYAIENKIPNKKYIRQLNRFGKMGEYFFVGFLSDKKRIICFRASS